MVINRHGEDVASGLIDEAEAVTFATDDVDHSKRNGRSALETTLSVDRSRVGHGDNTSRLVTGEHGQGGVLPPIT